tara:strand:+ start:61 stop:633 length:573 start_codon:yes stop_codon:yes gene_type:complete
MNTKEQLILKFRKLQTVFSVLLFFFILMFFLVVTRFDVKETQISHWGVLENVGWVFNYGIILVSISTFFNVFFYIKNHNRIFHKKTLHLLFFFVSISLFLVGLFPVDINPSIHNPSAFLYFFSYPFSIFLLSHLNRKNIIYKEWITHLVVSSLMIVLPLIFISLFSGMAIAEMVHTLLVMFWNIRILVKN